MPHPARARTFGWKEHPIVPERAVHTPPPSRSPLPHGGASSVVRFLDRLLLWIPNETSPGFLALCLSAVRILAVPMATVAVLLTLTNASANSPGLAWSSAAIWGVRLICSPVIHELCRYSFVRHASRPLRAAAIFACFFVLLDVLLMHTAVSVITNVCVELIASAGILFSLNYRRLVPVVIAVLAATDATGTIIIQKHTPSQHVGSVSQTGPTIGNMQSWAKLYPKAVITINRQEKILTLTQWTVSYDANATPGQISSFYEATARKEGFAPEFTVFGLRSFRNPRNGDRFTYSVKPAPGGSKVFFLAKYYEN